MSWTLDRREKDIREQEMRVQKWLHGDVDPLEEKQREIESLKQANEAAIRALRDEHEEATAKMQGGRVDEIEKLTQTIVEREERIRGYEETEANAKATKDQAEVDEFTAWLQEKAPHVYGDEEALYDLCVNVAHGKEWGDALKMTLALHPSPAAAAPAVTTRATAATAPLRAPFMVWFRIVSSLFLRILRTLRSAAVSRMSRTPPSSGRHPA